MHYQKTFISIQHTVNLKQFNDDNNLFTDEEKKCQHNFAELNLKKKT